MSLNSLIQRIWALLSAVLASGTPRPGPVRNTDGRIPADPAFKRLPLVVWGDAFPSGDRPQVRRALAGADAHECMYTWVYLNELVTVREMADAAARQHYQLPGSAGEVRGRFEALRSSTTDPQHQISSELPDVFLPAAAFLSAAGANKAEYCELGSTFFASIEKLDLCGRILGTPLDRSQLLFSGIEYSAFLKRCSVYFHPDDRIGLVTEPAEWQRSREYAFHVSRFVGSYAFRSTTDFATEIARCDAFHIIDAFTLGDGDFHSWDLGLPITFMNLPLLIDKLSDADFELFLTKVEPEFHAAGGLKAMVVRLFGIRRDVAARLRYFERFASLGGFASLFSAQSVQRGEGSAVVEKVAHSLTVAQWEAFAEYKKFFPIWGGPPGLSKPEVAELVSSTDLGMNLRFDSGQPAAIVRQAMASGKWQPEKAGRLSGGQTIGK